MGNFTWFGLKQAAKYAQINYNDMLRLVREDKIKHIIPGKKKVLTTKEWVNEYLVSLQEGGKSE